MNWIDFLAWGCILVPAISGFRAGLVAGLLKAAGILAGIGLAVWKMPEIARFCTTTLGFSAATAPLATLAAGIVGGWLLGMVAGWAWKKASEGTEIGLADRFAGFAMGAAKGLALTLVVLAGLCIALPGARADLASSWTGRHALDPVVASTRTWIEGRIEAWKK